MRRRRKRRVFWFPNAGTNGPGADVDDDDYGLFIQINLDQAQVTSSTFVTDLTFDRPLEEDADITKDRLQTVVGGEYMLRRIVGNCFVSRGQSTGNATAGERPPVLVTAGFFVARSEDSTSEAAGQAQPIGAETVAELRENYSPGSLSTIREPWIWRKRWILGNHGNAMANAGNVVHNSTILGLDEYPATSAGYPSKHTDASIDCRTIRRVSNDNRLWFVVVARPLNNIVWVGAETSPFDTSGASAGQVSIAVHLDYRLLGHMTRTRSTGTF